MLFYDKFGDVIFVFIVGWSSRFSIWVLIDVDEVKFWDFFLEICDMVNKVFEDFCNVKFFGVLFEVKIILYCFDVDFVVRFNREEIARDLCYFFIVS